MGRPITSPMFSELSSMGVSFTNTDSPIVATTGQTQNFADTQQNSLMYLKPAGTIAAQTVNLPSNANSRVGQECKLVSSAAITALTLGQIGGGATILGAPAGMTAGQTLIMTKVEANTWAVNP